MDPTAILATGVTAAGLGLAWVGVLRTRPAGPGDPADYLRTLDDTFEEPLDDYQKKHKGLAGYPGAKAISREEFFASDVDIFVPAALELQIGKDEAKEMACKVVVEGANGPTDLEGEKILIDKGIDVIPDILANSGGVIVSYYEWLQNKRSESWELEEVQMRLERRMRRSYQTVADRMRELKTDMRTTCYAIALERLREVYRARGIWP